MTGVTVISDGGSLGAHRVKICSAATSECTTDTNTVMYAPHNIRQISVNPKLGCLSKKIFTEGHRLFKHPQTHLAKILNTHFSTTVSMSELRSSTFGLHVSHSYSRQTACVVTHPGSCCSCSSRCCRTRSCSPLRSC